jgi:nonspecific dipeptidase
MSQFKSAHTYQHKLTIVCSFPWCVSALFPSPSSLSIHLSLSHTSLDGHLDVQPALKSDGWDTEPFEMVEINGVMYGRGTTDDKGPALSWLWMIEAFNALGIELPVNVKIVYEGMEEYGSEGMFETVQELSKTGAFLDDCDFFCISDNYWLGKVSSLIPLGIAVS